MQLCLLVVKICSVTPHRERRLEEWGMVEVVEILEEQGMMLVVEGSCDCLLDSAGLRVCVCVVRARDSQASWEHRGGLQVRKFTPSENKRH